MFGFRDNAFERVEEFLVEVDDLEKHDPRCAVMLQASFEYLGGWFVGCLCQ